MTPVIVELLSNGIDVKVVQPFAYTDTSGQVWEVPAGQVSDGASIPRALWTTVGSPLTGLYRRAAILHDHLYRTQRTTKAQADSLLREAAIADSCPYALAETIYEGVHLLGWHAWNTDKDGLVYKR